MANWALNRINRANIKISPQAKGVLMELARIRPDVARPVLKTISAKNWAKLGVERLNAPRTILDPFLAPVLRNIQDHIFDCLADGRSLDLSQLKRFLPAPKDIHAEMPFAFSVGEKPASLSEVEHSNLKLIRLLRKTHLRLLGLFDLRSRAKNSGDIKELEKIEFLIDGFLTPLLLAKKEIGPDEAGYRATALKRINNALLFLHNRITSAVSSSIISAHDLLCDETDRLEASRLKRSGSAHPKMKTVETPLGKEVKSLTLSGYGIKISPEGDWDIPTSAFKSTGTEHYKDKASQKVPEDRVMRQNRHILDDCSAELSNNIHNIKMLLSAEKIIDDPINEGRAITEGEAASIGSILYSVATKYERAFVREKEEVNDRLVEGIFQINRNLPKLCRAMITISIQRLNERNTELESMIDNLTIRGALEHSEIQFALKRDNEIRQTVHNLLLALANPRNISSAALVEGMAARLDRFLNNYLARVPRREYGIKRVLWRLNATKELLKRCAKMIEEKEGLARMKETLEGESTIRSEIVRLEEEQKKIEGRMRTIFIAYEDAKDFVKEKLRDALLLLQEIDVTELPRTLSRAMKSTNERPALGSVIGLAKKLEEKALLTKKDEIRALLEEARQATNAGMLLEEVNKGKNLKWYNEQISKRGALQRALDQIAGPLSTLKARIKALEDNRLEDIGPEQLSSAISMLTTRTIENLISAADALYITNLDVEFKHEDRVNEDEMRKRAVEENRAVREKIKAFKN